jgi:hypothetical protein
MRDDIKTILLQKPDQLLRDAAGAVAICLTFLVSLHLPGLF